MRPQTVACTAPGSLVTVPRTTTPASTSGRRGTPRPRGVTETTASAGREPTTTSTWATPGHRTLAPRWPPRPGWRWDTCRRARARGSGACGSRRHRGRPRRGAPGCASRGRAVPGDRLHLDRALHAGDPLELLGHAEGLEAALRRELHVLEVAAAAAARPGVWARWGNPVGRGLQDVHGVGPQVRGGGGRDPGHHHLAREGVAHEDDPSVGCPGDAAAAGGDGADLELSRSPTAPGVVMGAAYGGTMAKMSQTGVDPGSARSS